MITADQLPLRDPCRRIQAAANTDEMLFDAPMTDLANALIARVPESEKVIEVLCDLDRHDHFEVQGTEACEEYAQLKDRARDVARQCQSAA